MPSQDTLAYTAKKATIVAAVAASTCEFINDADHHAANAMGKFLSKQAKDESLLFKVIASDVREDATPYNLHCGGVIGTELGGLTSGDHIALAIYPIDGFGTLREHTRGSTTSCCAMIHPQANGLSVIRPLDTYYANKLVFGPVVKTALDDLGLKKREERPFGLHRSLEENIRFVASAHDIAIQDLQVVVLGRQRNWSLIETLTKMGIRPIVITNGDITPGIATCLPLSDVIQRVDLVIGVGGADEAIATGVGVKGLGGGMEISNWTTDKDSDWVRKGLGENGNLNRIMTLDEFIVGEGIFAATGIRESEILPSIQLNRKAKEASTSNLIIRGGTGKYDFRTSTSHLDDDH